MSRDYERPIAPKPYDFVPIAKPLKGKTVGHERIWVEGYVSGRLAYELRALTPVFVASGAYALGEDVKHPDVPVMRPCYRIDDVPAIPGSSLKGVVRSIAEAVSPSCVAVTRIDGWLLPNQPEPGEECTPGEACPACSMFGRLGRMSKVFFDDALLASGRTALYRLPALHGPRAHQARATYQTADRKFKGRKFYFHGRPRQDPEQPPVEVVVAGSIVRGSVNFENLTCAELGLLCFALGLDGSFALKLGGGKPACLGSLQVIPVRLELLDGDHFLRPDPSPEVLEGDQMTAYVGEQMQAAVRSRMILKSQVEELRRILVYPNERECPVGMY